MSTLQKVITADTTPALTSRTTFSEDPFLKLGWNNFDTNICSLAAVNIFKKKLSDQN